MIKFEILKHVLNANKLRDTYSKFIRAFYHTDKYEASHVILYHNIMMARVKNTDDWLAY